MSGIACAGHWVLDFVKIVDHWPNRAELSNIKAQYISNGGAPFNVLADIANLQVDIPTYGIGCLGNDDFNLLKVLKICLHKKISTKYLTILDNEKTSFTDVMTEEQNGTRTMFHFRGANDQFCSRHVPIDALKEQGVKLFYLGHLLLMAGLEQKDHQFGLDAVKLLHDVKKAGMETALDIATESADRYSQIVTPCLPYVDHLIINELEAGYTTKVTIRQNGELDHGRLKEAAQQLIALGVKKNVVIHMPEGALWTTHTKEQIWHPALDIPTTNFKATCGAGDAFCAGTLVGLHENWTIEKTLELATATSALSIGAMDNSDGIRPLDETLKIAKTYQADTHHHTVKPMLLRD